MPVCLQIRGGSEVGDTYTVYYTALTFHKIVIYIIVALRIWKLLHLQYPQETYTAISKFFFYAEVLIVVKVMYFIRSSREKGNSVENKTLLVER